MTNPAGAPDFRYTDRDVREDDSLTRIALNYIDTYTGCFEPILDARAYLMDHETLPTSKVRTVLNCMRQDYNVMDSLPIPERRPVLSVVKVKKSKKFNKDITLIQCERTDPHDQHISFDDEDERVLCNGILWEFTRPYSIGTALRVHPEYQFVMARQGKLIHLVKGNGDHRVTWTLDCSNNGQHRGGPREVYDVRVEVECNTRYIRNGILMTDIRADEVFGVGLHRYCQKCFDGKMMR